MHQPTRLASSPLERPAGRDRAPRFRSSGRHRGSCRYLGLHLPMPRVLGLGGGISSSRKQAPPDRRCRSRRRRRSTSPRSIMTALTPADQRQRRRRGRPTPCAPSPSSAGTAIARRSLLADICLISRPAEMVEGAATCCPLLTSVISEGQRDRGCRRQRLIACSPARAVRGSGPARRMIERDAAGLAAFADDLRDRASGKPSTVKREAAGSPAPC